ncbi:MAG: carboxypeptidase M32 [Actinomycetota bacterium]|nr:carboxypeptidase M32 [Actinomycetota bacterium]
MESSLVELKQRLAEIDDLQRTQLLLAWDTEVWMPPAGESSRGAQLATLETIVHDLQTDDRIGELLESVETHVGTLPHDSDDACLTRAARRLWEKNRRIPTDLAAEIAGAQVESYQAWVKAREEENFAGFRPSLERMLELQRRVIECFAPYDDPYDVVLDNFEEDTKTEDVRVVFAALQPAISALVAEHASEEDEDEFLRGPFPFAPQEALSRELIERFGASWDAFRLDLAVHPFAAPVGLRDIRLTTRYDEHDLNSLFTAMHECGHGLYEWGSAPSLERSPLQGGRASSALHESQSRLWENVVGRSLPFWRWYYPRVQAAFPDTLASVSLEHFHRAINRPRRGFIRVDADETSYGLHVILRFELEQELISGKLAVRDLPDAWNARFTELIGLEVPNDAVGVLQDTHWASGLFGYFPTYLLGSVLSVQIWEKAREALPDVEQQIERGEFADLHAWLRENLYALGSKFTPAETIERVIGGPIDPQPYLRYLRDKLSALAAA